VAGPCRPQWSKESRWEWPVTATYVIEIKGTDVGRYLIGAVKPVKDLEEAIVATVASNLDS
jgi:hypothetical protein